MRDEYDFSNTKRASEIPHLAELQNQGKSRINIMLDDDVLSSLRHQAKIEGISYQALINRTLRDAVIPHS